MVNTIHLIKDDRFNVDHIANYNLLIKLDKHRFKCCITDTIENRCLYIEDIVIEGATTDKKLIPQLEEIYLNHAFLQAGFWKQVRITLFNKDFAFIPEPVFSLENREAYLDLATNYDRKTEYINHYKQNTEQIYCVFDTSKVLVDWFQSKYPTQQIHFLHNTSPLIEGALRNTQHSEEKMLFLFAEKGRLTALVTQAGKLYFCNIFDIENDDQFLYFTMWALKEKGMDPDENHVVLFGDIQENSTIYGKLYEYIRNISFGDKPSFLHFGYQFDEVADHTYIDLYCMHLCE